MSLFGGDSMYGLLLRQIRRGDLCRAWIARCSSSQVTASNEPFKDQRGDVEDVVSPQKLQSSSRLSSQLNFEIKLIQLKFHPSNI